MASDIRTSNAIRTDFGAGSLHIPPGIAALFLIRFDIKIGYNIVWKERLPGIDLENAVEFKSLPSGLHNVNEDLVYFVHDEYAGLSAFINNPAAESERNALMLAVGILVPLSHGRLGRNWRHAAGLKELARQLAGNPDDTQPLTEYWDTFQLSDNDTHSPPDSPLDSVASLKTTQYTTPKALQRRRAPSETTALIHSTNTLAQYHPALNLPDFLTTFGPLIFPLYRVALLRKRILLLGDAPVEMACNFVYNLSLLSSLPHSLLSFLPATHNLPPLKPRPLFNVGVHDMASLLASPTSKAEACWIACTSDRVLGLKSDLSDVIVNLPPHYSKDAPQKIYPKVTLSSPDPVKPRKETMSIPLKSTQRDARRYLTLRSGLREFQQSTDSPVDEDDSDNASTFSSSSLVEPVSWPLLAYTSFIWWASAGEKGAGPSEEEAEQDSMLLLTDDDTAPNMVHPSTPYRRGSITLLEESNRTQEIALITYFRRLTTQIFTVLFDIISRQVESIGNGVESSESSTVAEFGEQEEEQNEFSTPQNSTSVGDEPTEPLLPSSGSYPNHHDTLDNDDDAIINISTSDITEMGLDAWSDGDRAFVEELVAVWWGRKAQVEGSRIKCCGVRIL